MMKRFLLLAVPFFLAACAALGPPAIHLSRSDIAERAFIDRAEFNTSKIFGGLDAFSITRPEVGFQPTAQRLEFAWTAKLNGSPLGLPISVRASVSGRPVLNAQRNGIDLEDARLEEIRLPSIPFINLDTRKALKESDTLGTIPLLQFRPDELNRDGIVYVPTALSLGSFGLRADLTPK